MTATAWLLVAVAVLITPMRPLRSARTPASGPAPRRDAPRGAAAGRGAAGNGVRPLLPAAAAASVAAALSSATGPARGTVLAVVLCPLAWAGTGRLLGRPVPRAPDPAVPLVLDLAAAALHSGLPLAAALLLAAPAGDADTAADLQRVAGLLRLGAEPRQAWAVVGADSPLRPLATVAVRSADSGMKVAAAFERLAADLRAERAAASAVRAHRAGVQAMGPLAACFLPSFVCLGVVPVVVGIARTVLATTGR